MQGKTIEGLPEMTTPHFLLILQYLTLRFAENISFVNQTLNSDEISAAIYSLSMEKSAFHQVHHSFHDRNSDFISNSIS